MNNLQGKDGSQDWCVFATCPICEERKEFRCPDDYWHWRGQADKDCGLGGCIPRQRAVADVLFSLFERARVKELSIHECSPNNSGLSMWLRAHCANYIISGYFEQHHLGSLVNNIRNENLEQQTFADETFDVVLHLDVLEHVFNPFIALKEIERTLKPGGYCLFAAPTYPGRERSEQVAFIDNGALRVVGEPEYHGNPNDKNGSLVTWRYGYDLPWLIARQTNFDIEVRRWYSRAKAIIGPMTEVYILRKPAPI